MRRFVKTTYGALLRETLRVGLSDGGGSFALLAARLLTGMDTSLSSAGLRFLTGSRGASSSGSSVKRWLVRSGSSLDAAGFVGFAVLASATSGEEGVIAAPLRGIGGGGGTASSSLGTSTTLESRARCAPFVPVADEGPAFRAAGSLIGLSVVRVLLRGLGASTSPSLSAGSGGIFLSRFDFAVGAGSGSFERFYVNGLALAYDGI